MEKMQKKNTLINQSNPDVAWQRDTPWDIGQNSEEIEEYFSGKLQTQPERKSFIQSLIMSFDMDEQQFYYYFLSLINKWKIYWYFSPLHKSMTHVLQNLAHIEFKYLTKLVVNQSLIYSIQPIAFLDCPCLKQVDIEENFITSLKPLKKTHFPSLIVMKFYYNNFNHDQNQHLTRMYWKNFYPLGLYHFCKQTFYSNYFKIQPNELKKIYVEKTKDQTLNNSKIIQKLDEKFIVQQFYVHYSKS